MAHLQNKTALKHRSKLEKLSETSPKMFIINTRIFAIQKKILRGINFVKITKNSSPALIQNLATLVWFLCNIHAATNSRKKKKNGRELICKNFGVNGKPCSAVSDFKTAVSHPRFQTQFQTFSCTLRICRHGHADGIMMSLLHMWAKRHSENSEKWQTRNEQNPNNKKRRGSQSSAGS